MMQLIENDFHPKLQQQLTEHPTSKMVPSK